MTPPLNEPPSWLKPPPTFEASLEERLRNRPPNSSRFNQLKYFSAIDAQRFIGYLGSRWRTMAHFWFTRRLPNEISEKFFLKQATNEIVSLFPNILSSLTELQSVLLYMMALLTLTGFSLAIPAFVKSRVAAQDGPFGEENDYKIEDPLTEILWDGPDEPPTDWWNRLAEAPCDIEEYIAAWRKYEGRKRVSIISSSLRSHLNVLPVSKFPSRSHVSFPTRD